MGFLTGLLDILTATSSSRNDGLDDWLEDAADADDRRRQEEDDNWYYYN